MCNNAISNATKLHFSNGSKVDTYLSNVYLESPAGSVVLSGTTGTEIYSGNNANITIAAGTGGIVNVRLPSTYTPGFSTGARFTTPGSTWVPNNVPISTYQPGSALQMAGIQMTYGGGSQYGGVIAGGIQQNVGPVLSLGTMNYDGTTLETMRSTKDETWFPAPGGVDVTGGPLTLQTQGSVFIPGTAMGGAGHVISQTSCNAATAFGANNFTIEFWVYPTYASATDWMPWFSTGTGGAAGGEIRIGQNIGGLLRMGFLVPNAGSTGDVTAYASTTTPLNAWSHIALVRNGNVFTFYYNGASNASLTSACTFRNGGVIFIGANPYLGDGFYTGYISGLHINNQALYTTNFTPSVSPFRFVAGTTLLMNMFKDASLYDSANRTLFSYVSGATWSSRTPPGAVGSPDYTITRLMTIGDGGYIDETSMPGNANNVNVATRFDIGKVGGYLTLNALSATLSTYSTFATYLSAQFLELNARDGGRTNIIGNSNTLVKIGPYQYLGTAANTTTYGLERSRHQIQFSTYRDTMNDKIGSKIVNINKQTYSSGARRDLIQSADLAFFTSSPGIEAQDETIERFRISDTGEVGVSSGTFSVYNGLTVITGEEPIIQYDAGTAVVYVFRGVGSGTFRLPTSAKVDYLIVGGGGGGGNWIGGGGGAGGLIYKTGVALSGGVYSWTVGGGGAGGFSSPASTAAVNGGNSVLSNVTTGTVVETAIGGGAGGDFVNVRTGKNGGSGGGGCWSGEPEAGGSGTVGPPRQGYAGGTGLSGAGGGGGGAGGVGAPVSITSIGGNGGNGLSIAITGTATFYAGGGGGAGESTTTASVGGLGGGGAGALSTAGGAQAAPATSGTPNTGGGGGGGGRYTNANEVVGGGSGVIIIRVSSALSVTSVGNSRAVNVDGNITSTNGYYIGTSKQDAKYGLPNTYEPGQYIFLGTWYTYQDGRKLRMTITASASYNSPGTDEMQSTELVLNTKNAGGSSAPYYLSSSAIANTALGGSIYAPSLFKIVVVSVDQYAIYGNFAAYTGNGSFYTVSISSGDTWINSSTLFGTTAPTGTVLTVAITGFMGVGTTSPVAKLHVKTGGDAVPGNLWDSTWMVVTSAATGAVANNPPALGFGYNVASNTAHIAALEPGHRWRSLQLTACNILLTPEASGGGGGYVGVGTTSPATTLDVNGSITARNGFRPTYLKIVSGTAIIPAASSYGTHYDINTSTITGLTIGYPASGSANWSNDSNGYWIFRNNTGTYLSLAISYTAAVPNIYPTNMTIPPGTSTTLMATYPGGGTNSNYVLF